MDRELVVRAQRGDRAAFEAVATSCHPRLLRIAHGILRDRHAAEDATQQALVELWRWLPRLKEPERFDGFSYRILVRACAAESKKRPPLSSSVGAFSAVGRAGARDPFHEVAARDELERAFARLSAAHRAIIVMRHLLDLPMEETAEALDIPIGTVASRLNRAMAALRSALEAEARPSTKVRPGLERTA